VHLCGLALQKLVEVGRGRGRKKLTDAILAPKRERGVDHILDEARPMGLHALPGAESHAGALCSFFLGPTPPNPTKPDGLAEFQPQLFRCL
jgi:hypothetical protein